MEKQRMNRYFVTGLLLPILLLGSFCLADNAGREEVSGKILELDGVINTAGRQVVGKLRDITGDLNLPLNVPLPDDETYMHPLDIIRKHGYSVEVINVTTEDKYINTMWRIQCPKNTTDCKSRDDRHPVLLQHGLMMAAADWLFLDPKSVLPFMLADAGYDVFMGNSRGNKYSMGHETWDAKDPTSEYWHFSVHEMGVYDIPANVDKILNITKKEKINYVGYSMGTTQFFIFRSEREGDYSGKIAHFVGLAPAAFIHNLKTPINELGNVGKTSSFHSALGTLASTISGDGPVQESGLPVGGSEVVQLSQIVAPLLVPALKQVMDFNPLLFLLSDGSPVIKNVKATQRCVGHAPAGASLRTIRHYVQFFASKEFRKFQHPDPLKNERLYNRAKPPKYNMTNLGVPSLFLFGRQDSLVVPDDARRSANAFTKCSDSRPKGRPCSRTSYCAIPCLNHLDFVIGPNKMVKENVYDQILSWFDGTWKEEDCSGIKFPSDTPYCDKLE